ncbi:hypothetical protein OROMI_006670 [Orobanche minor]
MKSTKLSRGFYVPEGRKGWVLTRASLRWRAFKTRLRKKYMYLKNGMLSDKPPPKYPFIRQNDWTKFVEYCTSDTFKELSEKNHERANKKISTYRGVRLGYQYFEEEIEKELEK